MPTTLILQLRGVLKSYGGTLGVGPIDFVVEEGEFVTLLGPSGCGKTTTLHAALHSINGPEKNIITIEDPVEFRFEDKRSIVHQREVGLDVADFSVALRQAVREQPDGLQYDPPAQSRTPRAAALISEEESMSAAGAAELDEAADDDDDTN